VASVLVSRIEINTWLAESCKTLVIVLPNRWPV